MLISLMLKVKLLNASASAYHPNMVGEDSGVPRNFVGGGFNKFS